MKNYMKNVGKMVHNGRLMYIQITDNGSIYLSGAPVEQYSRQLQEKARDFVTANKAI